MRETLKIMSGKPNTLYEMKTILDNSSGSYPMAHPITLSSEKKESNSIKTMHLSDSELYRLHMTLYIYILC